MILEAVTTHHHHHHHHHQSILASYLELYHLLPMILTEDENQNEECIEQQNKTNKKNRNTVLANGDGIDGAENEFRNQCTKRRQKEAPMLFECSEEVLCEEQKSSRKRETTTTTTSHCNINGSILSSASSNVNIIHHNSSSNFNFNNTNCFTRKRNLANGYNNNKFPSFSSSSSISLSRPTDLLMNNYNNNNANDSNDSNKFNNSSSNESCRSCRPFEHKSSYNAAACLNCLQLKQQKHQQISAHDSSDLNLQSRTAATAAADAWMKVLYLRQGVPDNFVPNSFLKDLRKNVNLEKVHLLDIILATCALTQQISSIVILISTFVYLDSYGQTPNDSSSSKSSNISINININNKSIVSLLFTLILLITMFLYLSTIFILPRNNVVTEFKSAIIFLVTGFAMSPILRTLTETISTDTIYAMVTLMMLVHLCFYNYGVNAAIVSKPISLNAAFFASVCLASRLSTAYHAFAFLIFAIDIFVLFAILYTKLPRVARTVMTVCFALTSTGLLYHSFSGVYSGLFAFLIVFVNLFCPFGYYKMQVYKENIYGPWDEAIIDKSNLIPPLDGQTAITPMSPTSPTSFANAILSFSTNNNYSNSNANTNQFLTPNSYHVRQNASLTSPGSNSINNISTSNGDIIWTNHRMRRK